jgi:phosphate-selective porin OprO/OprP
MVRSLFVASALTAALLVGESARAEDAPPPAAPPPSDIQKLVQEEVKAYLKAEKEKKEKEDKEKGVIKVSWKDGVHFESADKRHKATITGRIQVDYWDFPSPDEDFETSIGDSFDESIYFRRARLGFDITFLKNTRAKIEYDFARGTDGQGFADTYIAIQGLKECVCALPDVYIGHFQEPFSLEAVTSDNYNTFMEFNLATSTFAPFRNMGVMLQKGFAPTKAGDEKSEPFDRVLAQLGWFAAFANPFGDATFNDDGVNDFAGDQDGWAITGRVSVIPWVDCACPTCRVSHLGVSGSYRTDLPTDNIRFRSRPETGVGPRTIDTGNDIVADSITMFGAEAAIVLNRFSAQGEYMLVSVDAPEQEDPTYTGWYVQASYFLTGECRNYEKGKAVFGRVKPCRPLWCDTSMKGPGAWELAARFSTVDLDDGVIAVQGGKQWDLLFGVNWYLNNSVLVRFNYVHADIEDRPVGGANTLVDGEVDAFGIRVQAIW